MSKPDNLDIINLPLDKKILIEASAGTGKTFTIGLIVIRLLLKDENPLNIENIVLITFTEAATAELKKKTSEKINEAFIIWEKENYKEKDDLSEIIKKAKNSKDAAKKRANLQEAIARIDEMPVFTIHGFCARLLSEFAFETGNFEKKEIAPNLCDLEERAVIDFWREEIENLDETIVKHLPSKFSPDILKTGLNKVKNFPDAEIIYKTNGENQNLISLINKLEDNKKQLEEKCNDLKSKLDKDSAKNNIHINYNDKIEHGFKRIHGTFAKKSDKYLEYNACLDEYYNSIGEIENIGGVVVSYLQYKLAKKFLPALQKEKEKQKALGFNDLIQNTYNAVINDSEKVLFNAVQKRYEAILVDEFQDTDKMQYKIFDKLFENKPFFMIGDPKQAIYRFRGGDIYAYLEAKDNLEEAEKTMTKNFRSQEKLLAALNTIYKTDNPFENKKIKYITVSHGKELLPLKIEDKEQKTFILQNFVYSAKSEFYKITEGIIEEITYLLYSDKAQIYDGDAKEYRKIKAKDIAILTRTNDQAKEYRDALKGSKKKIPAVIRRSDSVFRSDAADYLTRLLTAFIHSQKESSVRAAIMELKPITQNDIMPFTQGLDNWKKYGIMSALNKYFEKNNLWGRILAEEDGERNATNLRQLIELLDKEEAAEGRIPERLLKRFQELASEDSEETEEKLETDDDAVQIMTIHTSKGLQFPVVFVPDITLAVERPGLKIFEKEPPVYHNGNVINIEYEISNRQTDEDNAKSKENSEILEESARNFYVAVTRAIYRVYVINAYKEKDDYPLSAGQKICKNITTDENIEIVTDLLSLEYRKNAKKTLSFDIETDNEKLFPPKVFSREILPAWHRTSFTDISNKLEHIEVFDKKRPLFKPEEPSGGIRMGLLLHSIFEDIDFSANENEISAAIDKKLSGYKEFSSEAGETKKAWVKEKVNVILNKDLHNAGKLSAIKDEHKTAELNFFMYSEDMRLDKIKEIMKNKINDFTTNDFIAKYLKGAIDLVFIGKDGKYYILDWKSNTLENYTIDGMKNEAMIPHSYHLQYYIYAAALKRWLEKTKNNFDFSRDFGGVYYIFIRGVKKESGNNDGIFFADAGEIIEDIIKLDNCFGGKR